MEPLSLAYCEQHRTKKATKGFKCTCPSCQGNDLWITTTNFTGYCWECGVSYKIQDGDHTREDRVDSNLTVRQFDTHAIRSLYEQATDYYQGSITTDHIQYLETRGVDKNAIDLFKIGFCPPGIHPMYQTGTAREAGIADSRGNPWLANRITFPYLADHEVTDLRGRVTSSAKEDDTKYKSLYHRSSSRGALYPFNYDRAMERMKATGTIILTEGELKAVVGDIFGFAIAALPGMLSYRPMFSALANTRIVVMFDNSSKKEDRIRVDRAIYRLTLKLPSFYVVTLPLLGENKMDVDSYLLHKQGGPQRLSNYIDNAVSYTKYRELRRF